MATSEHPIQATLQPSVSATRKQKRVNPWTRRDALAGYLFILPAIIGFTLFVVYPALATIVLSLTQWDGITAPIFLGLENFVYMFTKDPVFINSLSVTFAYLAMVVPISLFASLGLALLLNRKLYGVQIFRTIFYLPAVLPAVAAITLWKFVFNPRFGMLNATLDAFGLPTSLWLGDQQVALAALVIVSVWGIGTTTIVLLSALQMVPKELYEAAQIDGANSVSLLQHITFPTISPIIFLQLISLIVGALQEFNKPKLLTDGGPNGATNLLMYNIYKRGFGNLSQNPDLGYASAQVIILFVLIFAVTVLTFRFSNQWVYSDNPLN